MSDDTDISGTHNVDCGEYEAEAIGDDLLDAHLALKRSSDNDCDDSVGESVVGFRQFDSNDEDEEKQGLNKERKIVTESEQFVNGQDTVLNTIDRVVNDENRTLNDEEHCGNEAQGLHEARDSNEPHFVINIDQVEEKQCVNEVSVLNDEPNMNEARRVNECEQVVNGEERVVNGNEQHENGNERSANGEEQSANGEKQSANGEDQSPNGEEQSANGEEQSANGENYSVDQSDLSDTEEDITRYLPEDELIRGLDLPEDDMTLTDTQNVNELDVDNIDGTLECTESEMDLAARNSNGNEDSERNLNNVERDDVRDFGAFGGDSCDNLELVDESFVECAESESSRDVANRPVEVGETRWAGSRDASEEVEADKSMHDLGRVAATSAGSSECDAEFLRDAEATLGERAAPLDESDNSDDSPESGCESEAIMALDEADQAVDRNGDGVSVSERTNDAVSRPESDTSAAEGFHSEDDDEAALNVRHSSDVEAVDGCTEDGSVECCESDLDEERTDGSTLAIDAESTMQHGGFGSHEPQMQIQDGDSPEANLSREPLLCPQLIETSPEHRASRCTSNEPRNTQDNTDVHRDRINSPSSTDSSELPAPECDQTENRVLNTPNDFGSASCLNSTTTSSQQEIIDVPGTECVTENSINSQSSVAESCKVELTVELTNDDASDKHEILVSDRSINVLNNCVKSTDSPICESSNNLGHGNIPSGDTSHVCNFEYKTSDVHGNSPIRNSDSIGIAPDLVMRTESFSDVTSESECTHPTINVKVLANSNNSPSKTNLKEQVTQKKSIEMFSSIHSNSSPETAAMKSAAASKSPAMSNFAALNSAPPCVMSQTSDLSNSPIQSNNIPEDPTNSHSSDDDTSLLSDLDQELQKISGPVENSVHLSVENPQDSGIFHGPLDSSGTEETNKGGDSVQQEIAQLKSWLIERDNRNHDLLSANERMAVQLKEAKATVKSLQSADVKSSMSQIKSLEGTVQGQRTEIQALQNKLSSHDAAAKRAVLGLQNELKLRVDQVTKMYEDCVREKDSMVVKFAQAEQKNLETRQLFERADGRVRELLRERDHNNGTIKQIQAERHNAMVSAEKKALELEGAMKEIEKLKELLSSCDVRIKWAQNKHKAEVDAHRETHGKLEKMTSRYKEAKEEGEQIRLDCQKMIQAYQNSEEMRSSSLESELMHRMREKSDKDELYSAKVKELESLKAQHKDVTEQLKQVTEKMTFLDKERFGLEETRTRNDEVILKQRKELKALQVKVETLVHLQTEYDRAQSTIKSLDQDVTELKLCGKDQQIEIDSCRKRESELLRLTENLSEKNALLQSENTSLNTQVLTMKSNEQRIVMEIKELDSTNIDLEQKLTGDILTQKTEIANLTSDLCEKSRQVVELERRLADEQDQIKTIKRKHVNNVKDLTRQLQQARRRLETLESGQSCDSREVMGSRTSSIGSLNALAENPSNAAPSTAQPQSPVDPEYPVITEQVEVDAKVLIERIVTLQRMLARKSEKMEFMEDHVKQLIDEIRKKSRVIQYYVLREEAGALSPDSMDENKAQLSKKGGIMASVYNSHATDGHMSLELSMEINRKQQAVLEDALLKNITLKESFDTLGQEIARLSQENRRLQLVLQQYESDTTPR